MKPHKHAEVIKAWADGASIEVKGEFTDYQWWTFQADYVPSWSAKNEYRIKPEPNPDEVLYAVTGLNHINSQSINGLWVNFSSANSVKSFGRDGTFSQGADMEFKVNGLIKVIFDGETCKPKSAEVLK